ncbi:MAG: serine/threonine protein kinase [Nocardioides sp.]|nr:serine/threonine protein kinase [Nocardioides sp.]
MPHSSRPGDVLANRYRLIDLLAESEGGLFWRAHDRILERHVALHVIDADDERAELLLDAARRSATVLDRRILRVLDAEKADGLCYVVNEWGSGTSLDILLANSGPLSPRKAAWLVAEVADSIAVAHAAGVAHGRLVPENVLIDRTGAVKVIGFAVDAALFGLGPDRMAPDLTDLAALLYCSLTSKWAGASPSGLPRAPQEHGRVLRPRQVRAGVPRLLDALCDDVLNPYAGGRGRDPREELTARSMADTLEEFVGDPAGMTEAMAVLNTVRREETVVLPPVPEILVRDPDELVDDGPADPVGPEPGPPTSVELPTQAGLPIFDDDTDDVSWLAARTTPPPPPPPFEPPPERPLFAPEPEGGAPVRRPRPGSTHASGGTGPEFWPWDTGTGRGAGTGTGPTGVVEDEEVPGRNWLRLAAGIAVGLLLLVAIVVVYNLGRGKTPLGAEPNDNPTSSSPGSTTSATAAPLTGLVATDFDPQGQPQAEYPDLAHLAVDGNPATSWHTETYLQQFGPAGLKTGVGLRIDLGAVHDVSEVDLTMSGGTGVQLFVTDTAPTSLRGLTPVASLTAGPQENVTLDQPATGRYLVVWLTSLPAVSGGFRGEVAEVGVRG